MASRIDPPGISSTPVHLKYKGRFPIIVSCRDGEDTTLSHFLFHFSGALVHSKSEGTSVQLPPLPPSQTVIWYIIGHGWRQVNIWWITGRPRWRTEGIVPIELMTALIISFDQNGAVKQTQLPITPACAYILTGSNNPRRSCDPTQRRP